MDAVPWWDILRTGHAKLDVDHKELVDLFNRLADGVKNCKGKEFCGKALDNIVQYAKAHFELEERLMAEHRYPKAEQHIAEHATLIEKVQNYNIAFDADFAESAYAELVHFAEVWLCFHILFADKELAAFLSSGGRPPAQRLGA